MCRQKSLEECSNKDGCNLLSFSALEFAVGCRLERYGPRDRAFEPLEPRENHFWHPTLDHYKAPCDKYLGVTSSKRRPQVVLAMTSLSKRRIYKKTQSRGRQPVPSNNGDVGTADQVLDKT